MSRNDESAPVRPPTALPAASQSSAEAPLAEPLLHRSAQSGELYVSINGVIQSVSPAEALSQPTSWAAMIPDAKPHQVLILGLGAGTIAALLTQRFGPIPITGVDVNPRIVELGHQIYRLEEADLTVRVGDAFEFVKAATDRYDYIVVDLYLGGEIARHVFTKTFLKRLKRLAGPNGTVAVNIRRSSRLDRQLALLSEIFPVVETAEVGLNVVAKCRPA